MAASAALQEIYNVLQVCVISKRLVFTQLIDNKGFNLLKDFGVIDVDTYMLDMEKRLASRSITTPVNFGMVKIKGLQDIFWWIHEFHTHKQKLITAKFGQVSK